MRLEGELIPWSATPDPCCQGKKGTVHQNQYTMNFWSFRYFESPHLLTRFRDFRCLRSIHSSVFTHDKYFVVFFHLMRTRSDDRRSFCAISMVA